MKNAPKYNFDEVTNSLEILSVSSGKPVSEIVDFLLGVHMTPEQIEAARIEDLEFDLAAEKQLAKLMN